MKILIKLGAKLEAQDQYNRTPLYNTVMRGQVNAIQTLAEFGANLEAQDNKGLIPLRLGSYQDTGRPY